MISLTTSSTARYGVNHKCLIGLVECSSLLGLMVASASIFAQSPLNGLSQAHQPTRPSHSAEALSAELDGRYSFVARCVDHEGHNLSLAGVFVANRKGHITDGEEDFISSNQTSTRVALHGSYALDTNGIGNLTLVTSDDAIQNFSLVLSPDPGDSLSASLAGDDSVFGVHGTLKKEPLSPLIDSNYGLVLDDEIAKVDAMQSSYRCSL
jgi:hypothetical protein